MTMIHDTVCEISAHTSGRPVQILLGRHLKTPEPSTQKPSHWLIKPILFGLFSLLLVHPALADAPTNPITITTTVPVHVVRPQKPRSEELTVKTAPTLKEIAIEDAKTYRLDVQAFLATIQCESQWNPNAVSKTSDYGVAQINSNAHPNIRISQMLNPVFALNWMAKQWASGRASEWTCFRIISGEGSS